MVVEEHAEQVGVTGQNRVVDGQQTRVIALKDRVRVRFEYLETAFFVAECCLLIILEFQCIIKRIPNTL